METVLRSMAGALSILLIPPKLNAGTLTQNTARSFSSPSLSVHYSLSS